MADPIVLYHFPFQPASRAARLALGEARIDWIDTPVRPWEEDCPVHDLNPSGLPPVLQTSERGRPLTLCELPAVHQRRHAHDQQEARGIERAQRQHGAQPLAAGAEGDQQQRGRGHAALAGLCGRL